MLNKQIHELTGELLKHLRDFEYVREKIVIELINAERNRDELSQSPHRMLCDLAIVYRVILLVDDTHTVRAGVHNTFLDAWGITEAELYELAFENTKARFPVVIKPLSDIVLGLHVKTDCEDFLKFLSPDMPLDQQLFIITNSAYSRGASSILYDGILSGLAEKIGSDLYILPSSIHECILLSVHFGTPEELTELVTGVNRDQVALNEQLSDSVYHFSAKTGSITLVEASVPV